MQSLVVLRGLLLLLASSCLLQQTNGAELDIDLIWDADEATWRLESDYKLLAEVLTTRMEELNEPETIDGAMNALASLHKKWPQKADGFLGKIGIPAKKPIEAMALFEELGVAYNMCDYKSFKILKWNFFLAIGRNPAPLDPTKSKLHSVVRQAWEQHAATCRSEHLNNFKNLPVYNRVMLEVMRKTINKETVETIFGTTDLKTILSMRPAEVSERLPKSGEFWVRRTYEVSKGTKGEDHFKLSGNKIKLTSEAWRVAGDWPREAIQSRITNNCDWIFKRIDVFRPVMFDFVLDDEKLQEITQGDEEFEHTLAMAKACPALFDNRELLIKAVKKYV